MSQDPTNGDAEIQRLLDQDVSEPPASLDEEIRAAARDALADAPERSQAAARRWPLPALAGVAATALMAVLLVQLAIPPAPQIEPDALEQAAPVRSPAPRAKFMQGLSEESLRAVDQPMATAARAEPVPVCPEASVPLTAPGLLVCVSPEYLEIHSARSAGCSDVLRLARRPGEVTISEVAGGIEILIDGQSQWRVDCLDQTWRVDAP